MKKLRSEKRDVPPEWSDSVVNFQVYADPAGHPFCMCWVNER
jgi:hypothetical protein